MQIRNFYKAEQKPKANCHNGTGTIHQVRLFDQNCFNTPLKFISYSELPPETSIGIHTHQDNEEVYVILEGTGCMHLDGTDYPVEAGDVIVNLPFGTHGLANTGQSPLKVFIFEVSQN